MLYVEHQAASLCGSIEHIIVIGGAEEVKITFDWTILRHNSDSGARGLPWLWSSCDGGWWGPLRGQQSRWL